MAGFNYSRTSLSWRVPRGSVTWIAEDPSPGELPLTLETTPSPFRAELRVAYDLQDPGSVDLSVYDLAGHRVDELENGWMSAGHHELSWIPSSEQSYGCYMVLLSVGSRVLVSRCVLIR
jgi:hypothetical protein